MLQCYTKNSIKVILLGNINMSITRYSVTPTDKGKRINGKDK